MAINSDFWAGRRVLITGHTGFKGAWLSLWLQTLGADVTGVSSGPPADPSVYRLARVADGMSEQALDVRDAAAVAGAVGRVRPEVLIHLAAQPIVRRSLADPAMTYEVNVLGTVNVLEAVRAVGEPVRAVVVVSSDKCYENPPGRPRRLLEGDQLGGEDPYASSKACAELIANAYRRAFFEGRDAPRVGTARAGNVIGGGDWGEDRLIADVVRSVQTGEPLRVRSPHAVRPWQHVLNALGGYLILAQELCRAGGAARGWNFGPPAGDTRAVEWIVERLASLWRGAFTWELDGSSHPSEAAHLALDSSAAEQHLGWHPGWLLDEALERVVEWHEAHRAGADMRAVTLSQIERFESAQPPAARAPSRGAS